jgi:predicted amidophosphoribosyltransferase
MPASLARSLLSLVVPPVCVACREPELSGAAVCAECAAAMAPIAACCRRCGAPLPCAVDACSECRGRAFAFERAWAPFTYDGPARVVVLGLKGGAHTRAVEYMARAIVRRAPPGLLAGVLVPAPAHAERVRRHGQNHAHELAAAIGRMTGAEVSDALVRRPGGARQVGLERHARRANARGWIVAAGFGPAGAHAVVVDDVYTTGATLDACAAALLGGGAGAVNAVCFARTARGPAPVASRDSGA